MLYSVSPIATLDYSKREDRGAGEIFPRVWKKKQPTLYNHRRGTIT